MIPAFGIHFFLFNQKHERNINFFNEKSYNYIYTFYGNQADKYILTS